MRPPVVTVAAMLAVSTVVAEAGTPEVQVSVYETATSRTTSFAFDPAAGGLRPLSAVRGTPLPAIETFRIVSGRLCASECLLDADEILFQGRGEGGEVVVVRDEYNSFSNPLRWLAALTGHPVQVSRILVAAIRQNRVAAQAELAREPASYHWRAEVVQ